MSLVPAVARLSDLYRRTISSDTALALVAANAIPLVGVLFLGWSLWTILVLYWVENGIVGFWNVLKILTARGSLLPDPASLAMTPFGSDLRGSEAMAAVERELDEARAAAPQAATPRGLAAAGRIAIALFFTLHYGIFWLVHGVFVFALPSFAGFADLTSPEANPFVGTGPDGPFGAIAWTSVAIGAAALFVSHGASFVLNYLGRGENLRASPVTLLFAPYGRVVVLHLTILLGAFALAVIGAPVAALVVLVVLKTILDVRLHLAERRRFGDVPAAAPAAGAPDLPTIGES